MRKTYTGYGVLDSKNVLVWSCCNESESTDKCSKSLAILTRDRDYPGLKIVFWSQSALGSHTVTEEISSYGGFAFN